MTDLTTAPTQSDLFELRVPNDSRSLRIVLAALDAVLKELDFAVADVHKLRRAVDEACTNVLKHAYRLSERETYTVACSVEFGKLKVRVQDRGRPYDPWHRPQTAMGLDRIEHLAHELRYVNLGREGKAFDILYTLPGGWDQHPHGLPGADVSAVPDSSTLRVRRFQPEDAGQVARCAYSVYGYSYFGEHLYIPERLAAMNERGDLVSAVVVDDTGRVFGHLALVFGPGRVIPEEGQAFVLPTVRGGGWFKKLKAFLYTIAAERGLPGVFSDGVTVHPYTQKANLSLGARPCGILLAFAPGNVQFKQISAADSYRHSLVVFFQSLVPHASRRGFVPHRHAAIVADIFANLAIPFEPLPLATETAADSTVFDVVSNPLRGIAYLVVRQYGDDLVDRLKHQVRQLCTHGVAVIQLDMPMSHPLVALACEAIEALGFFFIGVVPRYFGDADSLRFEYLNNVEVHTESMVLEGDFTKQLLKYILAGMPD